MKAPRPIIIYSDHALVPLTQGQFAKVSLSSVARVEGRCWTAWWSKSTNSYYAKGRINGKLVMLHRYLLGLESGDRRQGDHVDHDTLNNTSENLRICTPAQNNSNHRLHKTNKSGYKGVSWSKALKKWVVHISRNNKAIHVGYFTCCLEAAKAYNKAAVEYYGEFTVLNNV